jgi:hypothetical protein
MHTCLASSRLAPPGPHGMDSRILLLQTARHTRVSKVIECRDALQNLSRLHISSHIEKKKKNRRRRRRRRK